MSTMINKFAVAARGKEIVILNPPLPARAPERGGSGLPGWPAVGPFSQDEALNLAAWIVAITGQRDRFLELLEQVERA